jgi:hypothetical protein
MKLKCKNKDCDSNVNGDEPQFSVNITVDEDGDVCESAKSIEGKYFTCNYCSDNAEWKDV